MIKQTSTDKVALITGGSGGIGRECVIALAQRGYNVAFTYLNNEKNAIKTRNEAIKLGVDAFFISVDISDKTQIEKMINEVLDKFGHIDVLVNNAGISELKKIEDIDEANWNKIIDTNLKGTFFCAQLVLTHMRKRKKGKIINMASQAGTTGGIFIGAHYSISKAGIICLTKTLAKIGAPFGILVNSVSPGLIETDMIKSYPDNLKNDLIKTIPLGRTGTPKEVAGVVAFLASDEANYITGANIPVNGGMLMV